MNYYLGYKVLGEYKPVNMDINKGLLDVVSYTTSFQDYSDLLDDLVERGAIESRNVKLAYIACHKTGKNTEYKKLYNGDTILLEDSKSFLNPQSISSYLLRNRYNLDLFIQYYYQTIKKLKVKYKLKSILSDDKIDYNSMINILTKLKNIFDGPNKNVKMVRSKITYLMDYINSGIIDKRKYKYLLDDLINTLFIDANVSYKTAMFFTKTLDRTKTFTELKLEQIINVVNYANARGISNYESDNDADHNLEEYIDEFMTNEIYVVDKKTKRVIIRNNQRIVNKRGLFDFGMFLYNYEMYNELAYSQINSKSKIEVQTNKYNDKEEYLTEEDYKRL